MIKKLCVSFLTIIFAFSSTSVFFTKNNSSVASAATKKCVNPYKGYLAKYNPCITHTSTSYIDVKKDKYGTPIQLTAVGVAAALADKKQLKKMTGKLISRVVPYAGQAILISDLVSVLSHYNSKLLLKNGIVKFKVVIKYKYVLNSLKDGGGIPEQKIISKTVTRIYKK